MHAQDDLNLHVFHKFEDTFLFDVVQIVTPDSIWRGMDIL